MKRVLVYSCLLILGLVGSQILPRLGAGALAAQAIKLGTMFCLGFIMIHVGLEFDVDRTRLRSYAIDYGIAATAAALPWLLCAAYFVFAMSPPSSWGTSDPWKQALLAGRFAAPTSAGILFAMLAAAGLSASWVFQKARVLAIFDDLDTVLLMIPLKMLLVGIRWQLGAIVVVMAGLLWIAWRYLHMIRLPASWPWMMAYAVGITLACEGVYLASQLVDDVVPVHFEVLLPAFVLGCVIAHGREAPDHDIGGARASAVVSAAFMLLVGLSMPVMGGSDPSGEAWPGWGTIALHTLALTVLANLGKMVPLLCYRGEVGWHDRLALCIGMWPRGEVGAGVLVVSLAYGISGTRLTAATLCLALNLLCTGLFIIGVKRLIASGSTAIRM